MTRHYSLYFLDGPDHGTIRINQSRPHEFHIVRIDPHFQPEMVKNGPELAIAEKGIYEVVGAFRDPMTGEEKAFYLWKGWANERKPWQ